MFLHETHAERFVTILKYDGTDEHDNRRKSFFYLLTADDRLFHLIKYMYNFQTSRDPVATAIEDLSLDEHAQKIFETAVWFFQAPQSLFEQDRHMELVRHAIALLTED